MKMFSKLARLAIVVASLASLAQAFVVAPGMKVARGDYGLGLRRTAPSSSRPARVAYAAAMSATAEGVEQKGRVTVYHKTTCPHCIKALALLEGDYGLDVVRVDVLGEDSEKKIKQMKTFSRRDTVPQIFFNSEHLGGNDDLQTLHEEGRLAALVEKVRAEAPGMMKDTWYHPWY